jgi:hypothetical protein
MVRREIALQTDPGRQHSPTAIIFFVDLQVSNSTTKAGATIVK